MAGKPKPKLVGEGSGRPSKFTPERCNDIVHDISNRIPYVLAAQANGISEKTLYNWLEKGEAHQNDGIDSEYTVFLQAIKKAERERMKKHLDIIADRPERWTADAWILERRWSKYFGNNSQLIELNNRLAKLEQGEKHEEESNDQERSRQDD